MQLVQVGKAGRDLSRGTAYEAVASARQHGQLMRYPPGQEHVVIQLDAQEGPARTEAPQPLVGPFQILLVRLGLARRQVGLEPFGQVHRLHRHRCALLESLGERQGAGTQDRRHVVRRGALDLGHRLLLPILLVVLVVVLLLLGSADTRGDEPSRGPGLHGTGAESRRRVLFQRLPPHAHLCQPGTDIGKKVGAVAEPDRGAAGLDPGLETFAPRLAQLRLVARAGWKDEHVVTAEVPAAEPRHVQRAEAQLQLLVQQVPHGAVARRRHRRSGPHADPRCDEVSKVATAQVRARRGPGRGDRAHAHVPALGQIGQMVLEIIGVALDGDQERTALVVAALEAERFLGDLDRDPLLQ